MFGIDSSELLVIVVVALLIIGPKDLPRVLYKVGKVVGQARGMARHFRTGLDAMVREAELEELQKQWDKENARIMAANPVSQISNEMKPLADEVSGVLSAPPPALPDGNKPAEAPATETPSGETQPQIEGPSAAPSPSSEPDRAPPAAPKDGAAA